jgi:hypothetical protein
LVYPVLQYVFCDFYEALDLEVGTVHGVLATRCIHPLSLFLSSRKMNLRNSSATNYYTREGGIPYFWRINFEDMLEFMG